MKNKNNPALRITFAIIVLVIILLAFLSTNLINGLLGSINSINTNNNNESINTGVVINSNLILDESSGQIPLTIYNGSKSDINIKAYIYKDMCLEFFEEYKTECQSKPFNVVDLDNQITIKSDEEYQYTIQNAEAVGGIVGIRYVLEDKTYDLYVYNFTPSSIDIIDESQINSIDEEKTSEEFSFEYESGKGFYVTLSDNDIHMNITENLSSFPLIYKFKAVSTCSIANQCKYLFESPIKESAFDANMLGEPNYSNIREYLDVVTNDDKFEENATSFDYSDDKKFIINGSPKQILDHQSIIPTFYFYQIEYWAAGPLWKIKYESVLAEDEKKTSNSMGKYTSSKVPQFKLTVYDKSSIVSAVENAKEKLKSVSLADVELQSWYDLLVGIKDASNLYKSRDFYEDCNDSLCTSKTKVEVTQSEIDKMVNYLNNYVIEKKQSADYTKYNNLLSLIESKPENWYTKDSYQKLKTIYDKRNEYLNINESYQSKLDIYVDKLQQAFDELVMKEADYSKVEEAKKKANELSNKTDDGKYDLYTNESWQLLQDALNSVDENLKINEQEKVDSFAEAIENAINNLEVALAKYDELNDLISNYRDSDAYLNDWYTTETKTLVDEYIKAIAYDKKITEQSEVNNYVKELQELISNLKFKMAKGYLDSDNYHPFDGALSLESYVRYLKTLDEKNYTENTMNKVNKYLLKYENISESDKLTIDKQEEMDDILEELHNFINNGLEKRPGDYTKLREIYDKALDLNLYYYEDVSDLQEALSDVDWDLKIDEQNIIDEQTKRLKEIIDNLVMKDANYEKLEDALKSAEALNPNHYVDFSDVEEAKKEAEKARKYKIDKQQDVDKAASKLQDAIDKLVLKNADYSKIEALISIIESLDKNKYTNFEIVEEALNNIVYGKKANEQELVDQMYKELKEAYGNLKKTKADYTNLEKAIKNAKGYEQHKSYYRNWNDVQKLLDSVDYNLTWEDQSKVDDLAKKINDAVSNLKKRPADYTDLSDILSEIPNDYSDYSESLQKEIGDFLKKAKDLPTDLTFDEQSIIDELVQSGKTLVDKLKVENKNQLENATGNSTSNGSNNSNSSNNDNKIEENSTEIILSYLEVNGTRIDISKSPFKYMVNYDVSEAKILVGLTSSDSTSKVYGGKVLVPGDNNITIIVTTKDGKTYTYTLVITRAAISNYLKDLSINKVTIDFNKTKYEYNVKIGKDINKLDLFAIAEDENAKVTIKGNKNIKNGSKVTIEVESPDGDVRVYTLNIQKASSVDKNIMIVLIMILTVIAVVFKYIRRKRKIDDGNNA